MAFNWRDYLGLAQELADSNDTRYPEAASRAAVSRAYFAAHNVALDYARREWAWRPPLRGADKHQAVIQKFRQQQRHEIADRLVAMRNWRNNADYEDTVPGLDVQLQFTLSYTQDVLELLT